MIPEQQSMRMNFSKLEMTKQNYVIEKLEYENYYLDRLNIDISENSSNT